MKIETADFNLEATLESGQVFGFSKGPDGFYEGYIYGKRTRLRQENNFLQIETDEALDPEVILKFFHLDFDLTPVYDLLLEERMLKEVRRDLRGLRVIRQEPWEALACFIISSNNNIKRIQKIRRNLSKHFCGSEFQFPSSHYIAASSESTLRELGLGYRAAYLFKTAQEISSRESFLSEIAKASYDEGKEMLVSLPGIGEKVADCVLLFGFQKYEAFPVDVWILKAVRKLYFRNRKVNDQKIREFGRRKWKEHAGYVQQYLFHAAKSGMFD